MGREKRCGELEFAGWISASIRCNSAVADRESAEWEKVQQSSLKILPFFWFGLRKTSNCFFFFGDHQTMNDCLPSLSLSLCAFPFPLSFVVSLMLLFTELPV